MILAAVAERLCSNDLFLALRFFRGELAMEPLISLIGPENDRMIQVQCNWGRGGGGGGKGEH